MSPELLLRLEVQALFDAYADALDNDRVEDWPGFFVDDCLYEILPKENEDHGLPAPVIHCDNRRMLNDRVVSLRNANIFAPVNYRHMMSALVCHEADGEIVARSNYIVINTNPSGSSSVYQAGRYDDRIVRTADGLRFCSRRVIYDTSRVQTLLAIPI